MAEAFLFYLFSSALLLAAALTLLSRNPVHSVLWLILAFLNAAGLMLMLGAEFIAMMLVIVYVGAVAILFLFVVMMLDTDAGSSRSGLARNWVVGLVAALIALIELVAGLAFWTDV